jgi:hypothetical protein
VRRRSEGGANWGPQRVDAVTTGYQRSYLAILPNVATVLSTGAGVVENIGSVPAVSGIIGRFDGEGAASSKQKRQIIRERLDRSSTLGRPTNQPGSTQHTTGGLSIWHRRHDGKL